MKLLLNITEEYYKIIKENRILDNNVIERFAYPIK
jgi:hypothetical protein